MVACLASIYGTRCYVVSYPVFVEHVLLKTWPDYVKGHTIKRVAQLLGKGLMVSEDAFWASQRRLIQAAFHQHIIGGLSSVIASANSELLDDWTKSAYFTRAFGDPTLADAILDRIVHNAYKLEPAGDSVRRIIGLNGALPTRET